MAEDVMPNADAPAAEVQVESEGGTSDAMWIARIAKCKTVRKQLLTDWNISIDYRRGKQFATESDQDRVSVNADWPLTKAKHASLFSQVPAVTVTSDQAAYKPIAALAARALNKRLARAKVDVCMDEVMPDTINAAGIGACYVGYDSRSVMKKVGTDQQGQPVDLNGADPAQLKMAVAQGMITVTDAPQVVDTRFYVQRISPADLLWPVDFTGSDFDDAPWVGRSSTMSWAEAKNAFKLTDEQKEAVAKGDTRTPMEKLSNDYHKDSAANTDIVSYNELYYWNYCFNADELYFSRIMRIVFVDGIEKSVLNEPWKGQKWDEQNGTYTGACKFPIRFLTLTYLTDEAIPPSDSAIGRPQVDEQIRSRSQMIQQRERSQPMRYFDVNRIDPTIQDSIMRGTYQGMIPVNGDGSRAIGEVARANYPHEDFEFDRVVKADLQEMWQTGSNQMGTFGGSDTSASEAKIVQSNFQTRSGQERARVAKMFVGVAEVMWGLMALYDDFTELLDEQEAQKLKAAVDASAKNLEFIYNIRPDSTVLLDSEQRIQRLLRVLNMLGKSGFVDPEPIIAEIVTLSGLDPAAIVRPPQQPGPEPAKVGLTLSGAADLHDPLMLAFLVHTQQAPNPTELDAAKALLIGAGQPPKMPEPQGPGGPGGPPPGPEGEQPKPGIDPKSVEDWNAQPRITKRPDELGG